MFCRDIFENKQREKFISFCWDLLFGIATTKNPMNISNQTLSHINFNFFFCFCLYCDVILTCKLTGIWWSSFFQLNTIGISPDETAQVTWALPPSCKFFGNENGSITGGPNYYCKR